MTLEASTTSVRNIDLADLIDHADDIVFGTVSTLDDDLLSPPAQILMKVARRLLKGDKGTQDRLAYICTLMRLSRLLTPYRRAYEPFVTSWSSMTQRSPWSSKHRHTPASVVLLVARRGRFIVFEKKCLTT